jgi:hypothetical protein
MVQPRERGANSTRFGRLKQHFILTFLLAFSSGERSRPYNNLRSAKRAAQTRPLRTPSRVHPPTPRVLVAVVARQPLGVPLKPFVEDLVSEPLRSWTVNSGAAQLFDVQDVLVGIVEEEHVFERHLRTLRDFS